MEMNVGPLDRFIRIGLGTVVLYYGLMELVGSWGIFVGTFILTTGLSGMSPTYAIFKISTESKSNSHAS